MEPIKLSQDLFGPGHNSVSVYNKTNPHPGSRVKITLCLSADDNRRRIKIPEIVFVLLTNIDDVTQLSVQNVTNGVWRPLAITDRDIKINNSLSLLHIA